MNTLVQLGARIREFRKAADLTQAELAEKAVLSINFIAVLETGRRSPSVASLEKVSSALIVPI